MKRDNIIIVCISMLLMCACDNERLSSPIQQPMTFSAVTESDNTTKTSLGTKEGGIYRTLWNEGDTFDVMCDNAGPYSFTLADGAGSAYGRFQGEGLQASRYTALYPQGMNPAIVGNTVSFALPQTQQYKESSFGDDAFPMIAVSKGTDFVFKNLCSVLKLSLKGEYEVRSIVFKPNDNTLKVSGDASVSLDFTNGPEMKMGKDASSSVQLDCGDKLLNSEQITDFYIVMPPQTYKDGFTIEINTTNWVSPLFTKSTNKDFKAERSMLYSMAEFELDDPGGTGDPERDALIALYNATDGNNWTHNDNWCSDRPLSEWYGIDAYNGHVTGINLPQNNIVGKIPENISQLTALEYLYLDYNFFNGTLPSSITKLGKLRGLSIRGNYGSGEPGLSGALPEDIGDMASLEHLDLECNSIEGSIPASFTKLKKLYSLCLSYNNLSGTLPSSIGDLSEMRYLHLNHNHFSGALPNSLCNLSKLEMLFLGNNEFSGTFPAGLTQLSKLTDVELHNNNFSAPIPNEYLDWKIFRGMWGRFVLNNNISESEFYSFGLKAPDFHIIDINGQKIDATILNQYKYTALLHPYNSSGGDYYNPKLAELFDEYHVKGFNVIEWASDEDAVRKWANQYRWTFFCSYYDNRLSGYNPVYDPNWYPGYWSSALTVVDSTGIILKSSDFDSSGDKQTTIDYIKDLFEEEHPEYYTSTDYSADGTVKQLQSATKGNGIDIVLMGDAYSDRLISDGTYDAAMQDAMEAFFTEEPYKSYREMFNVYNVRVVSKNEVYDEGAVTALKTGFGEGTKVYGNDSNCMNYALNAISKDRMDASVIIVVCNSDKYAGTCYMYYPSENTDWGDGLSISYFPLGTEPEDFGNVLRHEAAGHGFSKLLDEYAYESQGQIPQSEIDNLNDQAEIGWGKNIDIISDPAKVKWAKFISDERYKYDGLGVFEGADTYWTGVFRPTEYSIMRYNTGGFNAPSRESIYYRINKLAYGKNWQYDYEDFVEYDAINRKTSSSQSSFFREGVSKLPEPTHPPVIVGTNWRDAVKTGNVHQSR